MTRRSMVSMAIGAVACVVLAVPAFAQTTQTAPVTATAPATTTGKAKQKPAKPFKEIEAQLKALNLTAEQQEKVTAVLKQHEPEARTLTASMQKAKKANDEKAIAEGKEQTKALRSKVLAEVRPLLTPDQQKQLKHAKKNKK